MKYTRVFILSRHFCSCLHKNNKSAYHIDLLRFATQLNFTGFIFMYPKHAFIEATNHLLVIMFITNFLV